MSIVLRLVEDRELRREFHVPCSVNHISLLTVRSQPPS
jgi:hypothetical protein